MPLPQPGWYADPARTSALRWWDGARWTVAVVRDGVQTTSPLSDGRGPLGTTSPDRVRDQVQRRVGLGERGGGPLFTEPLLFVRPTVGDGAHQHAVCDERGREIGSVEEVGRGALWKAAHLFHHERFLPSRVEVRGEQGVPQLLLVRAALAPSRVVVRRPGLGEVGQLVREPGRVRFGLHSGGRQVGSLHAEDGQAGDVRIADELGAEVARVRKTLEGMPTPNTHADSYVAQVHHPLQEPLLSLVVASALSVGTALQQDVRGLG